MKKMIATLLVATCAGTGIAFAETPDANERGERHGMRAEMRELIRGDGMDAEALAGFMQARAEAMFDRLDADGDGTVTREEFLARVGERAASMFERMDRSGDGVVSRADRPRWMGRGGPRHERGEGRQGMRGMNDEERAERRAERTQERFTQLDTDGDGMISQEEFAAGIEARVERRAERMERGRDRAEARGPGMRGEGMRGHGMRGGPGGEMRAEMRELMRGDGMTAEALSGLMEGHAATRFDALDADGDGTLTREEFLAGVSERAAEMFARMDRDGDGLVTRADRPARGEMRGWHGRHGGGMMRGWGGPRGEKGETPQPQE